MNAASSADRIVAGLLIVLIAGIAGCSAGEDTSAGNSSAGAVGMTVGSAQLSWTEPKAGAGGELVGFKIYYGTSRGAYTESIVVPDARARSYTVSGLAPGTYFFVVTAYDSNQNESGLSAEVSKAIR